MRIGVISDTHGLLRPEAVAVLQGSQHVLHAGDVGDSSILDHLARIAPVTAIRGNIDGAGRCAKLPETEYVEFGDISIYMLHDLKRLDLDPLAASVNVVISGHSHQPAVDRGKGILFLNPGSAGPRRFSLPVSLALLHIENGNVTHELFTLV